MSASCFFVVLTVIVSILSSLGTSVMSVLEPVACVPLTGDSDIENISDSPVQPLLVFLLEKIPSSSSRFSPPIITSSGSSYYTNKTHKFNLTSL